MPVTRDQAHMLAALARGVQAETHGKAQSDEPGIVANLEPLARMSLAEVMRAVSRWAEDRDAKTPGLLKDARSSCWRERSEQRPTPRNPRPSEMCGDCGKPDGPAHPVDHPFEHGRRSECDASTEVAHLRGPNRTEGEPAVSTYVYLRCEDHDPPLTSDGESGQHLYDLDQIRADIANRDAVAAAWRDDLTSQDSFRRSTARFLAEHPKCQIGIVDEYRRVHPLTEKPEEPLGLGAVVRDVWDTPRLWVRTDGPDVPEPWSLVDGYECRAWADITGPIAVLADGWTGWTGDKAAQS